MKKYLLFSLIIMLFQVSNTFSDTMKKIRIIVNTPFNTPEEGIFLTGDIPGLCHWEANCYKLKQLGNGSYIIKELKLPNILKKIEIKITRGSWEREAADEKGKKLDNISIDLSNKKSEFVFAIKNWKDLGPLQSIGDIRKHENFYSPQLLNSRSIHVLLPKNYKTSIKKYPVIYMHDGQNLFDPTLATYGVDWSIDDILYRLNREKILPECIVVGIFHKTRIEEYEIMDKGKLYGEFLVDTLKPFIDSNYRTLPDRKHTSLMGSSMGALISFSLLWSYPETFSKAAAISLPAFVHNNSITELIKTTSIPLEPIQLYMDHGTYGLDRNYRESALNFFNLLRKKISYKKITYLLFPYADHSETDWARRVHLPLEFLLKGAITQ